MTDSNTKEEAYSHTQLLDEPSQISGALELTFKRNYFYYENYRKQMKLFLLLLLTSACLGGFGYYLYDTRPRPVYFATSPDGTIVELVNVTKPNLEDEQLIRWTSRAITRSYAFDFVNYRKQLQNVRNYFTLRGYNEFLGALKESNNLTAITNKRLVASVSLLDTPKISKKGIASGRYTWLVDVPLRISYQSSAEVKTTVVNATLRIKRISSLASPIGVGIDQVVLVATS